MKYALLTTHRLGGRVVMEPDLRLTGRGCELRIPAAELPSAILGKMFTHMCPWAPTGMGMGGGHLPSPGKIEKCYHVKKKSISEVSLNALDAIGLGVCNHILCKLNSRMRSPNLDWEANANCPQILPFTRIWGKNRSRRWF